jgi:hypothetical protein
MGMPNQTPPPLLRPAVIAIRYHTEARFDTAVSIYQRALGIPGYPGPGAHTRNFDVGSGPVKDMQLHLSYTNGGNKANRTVVYWEVSGKWYKNLYDYHANLRGPHRYVQVEVPDSLHPRPFKTAEAGATTLRAGTDQSLLRDGSDNLVGLVINPPVPTFTKTRLIPGMLRTKEPHRADYLVPIACLLVGVLLGWLWRNFTNPSRPAALGG